MTIAGIRCSVVSLRDLRISSLSTDIPVIASSTAFHSTRSSEFVHRSATRNKIAFSAKETRSTSIRGFVSTKASMYRRCHCGPICEVTAWLLPGREKGKSWVPAILCISARCRNRWNLSVVWDEKRPGERIPAEAFAQELTAVRIDRVRYAGKLMRR